MSRRKRSRYHKKENFHETFNGFVERETPFGTLTEEERDSLIAAIAQNARKEYEDAVHKLAGISTLR